MTIKINKWIKLEDNDDKIMIKRTKKMINIINNNKGNNYKKKTRYKS